MKRLVFTVVLLLSLGATSAHAESAAFSYAFRGSGNAAGCTAYPCDGAYFSDALDGVATDCAGACVTKADRGSLQLILYPTDPLTPTEPHKCSVTRMSGHSTIQWSDGAFSAIAVTVTLPPSPVRAWRAHGTVTDGVYAGRRIAVAVERSVAASVCAPAAYDFVGTLAIS